MGIIDRGKAIYSRTDPYGERFFFTHAC